MGKIYKGLSVFFTKKDLTISAEDFSGLNSRIHRRLKSNELLKLKNGLYTLNTNYLHERDKVKFAEFAASQLCSPSYVSLEYALNKYNLLFCDSFKWGITSVTSKTGRIFENFLGVFNYKNVKDAVYFGFEEIDFNGEKYFIATKAKALFDFLYLKPDLHHRHRKKLKKQLFEELGIQWINFSEEDFKQFDKYVWKSNSRKMMRILYLLNEHYTGKKFDRWAKEFFS